MTHDKRMRELEQAAEKLGLGQWCGECGGLDRNSARIMIIPYTPYDYPTCAACGLKLNKHGKPFGRLDSEGNQVVKTLVLSDGDPTEVLPHYPMRIPPLKTQDLDETKGLY